MVQCDNINISLVCISSENAICHWLLGIHICEACLAPARLSVEIVCSAICLFTKGLFKLVDSNPAMRLCVCVAYLTFTMVGVGGCWWLTPSTEVIGL